MATTGPSATCQAGFDWMNNGKGQGPCTVMGWILSSCTGQSVAASIPPLTSPNYNAPDSNSQNSCTCSWSFYNAAQACTACQNHAPESWTTWSSSCNLAGLSSTTQYWPGNVTFSGQTSFPRWAIVNPMSWDSQTFNVNQALAVDNQNLPDATDSSASQPSISQSASPTGSGKKSVSVGPIVGGVVGGIVVLGLIIGLFVYFLLRQRRIERERDKNRVRLDIDGASEAAMKLFGNGDPATTMHSSPASPQIHPVAFQQHHRQTSSGGPPGSFSLDFNPYAVYDTSAAGSHAHTSSQMNASSSGTNLMATVAPLPGSNSSQPVPVRAFPGIPSNGGRIPTVEEQLSEKRRLRSEMRKNSNPPLSGTVNNSTTNRSSSEPSPVRSSPVDNGSGMGYGSKQSRNTSTDSLGRLKHRRGSSSADISLSNNAGTGDVRPTKRIWQNHQQSSSADGSEMGDENGNANTNDNTNGNENENEGDEGTAFLSMRARGRRQKPRTTGPRPQSVDDVMASVPGARAPTQKERENPPPMYVKDVAGAATSPIGTVATTSISSPTTSRAGAGGDAQPAR